MKKFFTVMCLVSAMAVSGCATEGNWTPMSGGRTAGDGTVMKMPVKAVRKSVTADTTFNSSLRK